MNLMTRVAAGATALAMVGALALAVAVIPAGAVNDALDEQTIAQELKAATLEVSGTLVRPKLLTRPLPFEGKISNLSVTLTEGAVILSGTLKGTGLPVAGTPFSARIKALVRAANPPMVAKPAPLGGGVQAMPVVVPTPTPSSTQPLCRVLTLDIDSLHLDLLGLVVQVPPPGLHLIVAGAPRPGALLGNLLCAIAGRGDPVPGVPAPLPLPVQPPALLG